MIIKTENENYWIEIEKDNYNWIVSEFSKGMHFSPKDKKEIESVSKNTIYPANLSQVAMSCFNLMAKQKLNCESIKEFISELKKIEKNIIDSITKNKGD